MAAVLEWKEPTEVQQWQWQFNELPYLKSYLRMFVKWWLLLGVPSLFAIAWFAPTEFLRLAGGLVCLLLFIVEMQAGLFWVTHKTSVRYGVQYSVEEKGLRRRGSNGTKFYQWKHIECYRVVPHSHLPGICVLELKVMPSCPHYGPHNWAFSSTQLDESELRGALVKHWPECEPVSAVTQASQPAA